MGSSESHADVIRSLEEAVAYFSPGRRGDLERWVATEFLKNLGVRFEPSEVEPREDDPPDVVFRDARFEVKERLDLDRRRHEELKDALTRARAGALPCELLEDYAPEFVDPSGLGQVVLHTLEKLKRKRRDYAPRVRSTLDLLIYVNLLRHMLKEGPMPDLRPFAQFGWRSVSVLMGWGALVFCASDRAPEFLQAKAGPMVLQRHRRSGTSDRGD